MWRVPVTGASLSAARGRLAGGAVSLAAHPHPRVIPSGGEQARVRARLRHPASCGTTTSPRPVSLASGPTAPQAQDVRPLAGRRRPGGRSRETPSPDRQDAVCFLAADESSYITGQIWAINGGLDM